MRNKPYAIGNYEAPSILKRRVGSAEDVAPGNRQKAKPRQTRWPERAEDLGQ